MTLPALVTMDTSLRSGSSCPGATLAAVPLRNARSEQSSSQQRRYIGAALRNRSRSASVTVTSRGAGIGTLGTCRCRSGLPLSFRKRSSRLRADALPNRVQAARPA